MGTETERGRARLYQTRGVNNYNEPVQKVGSEMRSCDVKETRREVESADREV